MKLRATAHEVTEAALAFFYPEACQICEDGHATAAEGYVCTACWRNFRFITEPICDRCGLPFEGDINVKFECTNCRELELQFTRARSVIEARGMALDIIHRYKYSGALWFEPLLAQLLVNAAAARLREEGWELLVPVPLHPMKQAEREFNQAERLARHLGRAAGIPVATNLVRRTESTRTQTRLSREERARNVRRAFSAVPGARCPARRVVLIDDVLTTGATTSACAGALLRSGAGEVCVWTLARGLLH